MEIQIFDCAVGDTLHIGNKIKLTILESLIFSGSCDAPAVKLQIGDVNFILAKDKVNEEIQEV